MAELFELLDRTYAGFARALAAAAATHDWHRATPCAEWDLTALTNHVVAEDLWVPALLSGKTLEEVGDRFDGDVVGDDPAAAWESAGRQAREAFREVSMDTTVHTSAGERSAEAYGWEIFADHLIHTWDVAVSVGADARMDADCVAACARWFDDYEDLCRRWGIVADPVPVDPAAGPGRSAARPVREGPDGLDHALKRWRPGPAGNIGRRRAVEGR